MVYSIPHMGLGNRGLSTGETGRRSRRTVCLCWCTDGIRSRGRMYDRGNEFRRCVGLEDGYDNVAHVGCSGWVIKGLPWKSRGIGGVEVHDSHGKNTYPTVVRIVLYDCGCMAERLRNDSWVKAKTRIIVAQVLFDGRGIKRNGEWVMGEDCWWCVTGDLPHQECPMGGCKVDGDKKVIMCKARARRVF